MMALPGAWVSCSRRLLDKRLVATITSQQSRLNSTGSEGSDGGVKDPKDKLKNLLKVMADKKREQGSVDKDGRRKKRGPKLAQPSLKDIEGVSEVTDVKGIQPEVVHAVSKVAQATAEATSHKDDDTRQRKIRRTESDLLSKLKSVARETEEAKAESEVAGKESLATSILSNMKVKSMEKHEEQKPLDDMPVGEPRERFDLGDRGGVAARRGLTEEQLQFLEERKRKRRSQLPQQQREKRPFQYTPVDILNSGEPLGIFEKGDFDEVEGKEVEELLPKWAELQAREMRILTTMPPRNFLEDMARMTDRGELWHFPIDNEQGIDTDSLEPFYDHVFLDHHLEGWCPQQGALRHFMELVCVGLSKNPYISAEKKVEHINWYRDYFMKPEHKDILRASGAMD